MNSKHSQEFLFGTVSAPLVLFFNYKFICISSIDKCFTVSNLIILRTILFLEYRKTPETQGFWGILRLDTTLSYDNKSIFRLYYSMIVATRPDPTVRPPSRYQTGVLRCTNGDFSCDSWGKIRIFHCVRVVFGDFVIMMLSHIIQFSNFANNNPSLYRLYDYL